MTELGKRVAERRAELGISQDELANLVGVTQGAISFIERGIKSPSLELLLRLQETLDIVLIPLPASTSIAAPEAQAAPQ